jgi:hypothetical protein
MSVSDRQYTGRDYQARIPTNTISPACASFMRRLRAGGSLREGAFLYSRKVGSLSVLAKTKVFLYPQPEGGPVTMIEEFDLCSCCGLEPRNFKVRSRSTQISDLCTDCWELEGVIHAIVKRKEAAEIDSAEWLMAERQLDGLRHTRQFAGPLIEEMDW